MNDLHASSRVVERRAEARAALASDAANRQETEWVALEDKPREVQLSWLRKGWGLRYPTQKPLHSQSAKKCTRTVLKRGSIVGVSPTAHLPFAVFAELNAKGVSAESLMPLMDADRSGTIGVNEFSRSRFPRAAHPTLCFRCAVPTLRTERRKHLHAHGEGRRRPVERELTRRLPLCRVGGCNARTSTSTKTAFAFCTRRRAPSTARCVADAAVCCAHRIS